MDERKGARDGAGRRTRPPPLEEFGGQAGLDLDSGAEGRVRGGEDERIAVSTRKG